MARTKREIDKELMYKKLMPSEPKMFLAPDGEAAPDDPDPAADPAEGEPASFAVSHRVPRPRKVSVPTMDSRKTEVINVMEAVVLEKLDSVLSRFQCCCCDRCKKDIVALALNKLPPKYRVLLEGQPPPEIDPQLNAQVVTAMIQAVIQVRAKPRH